MTEPQTRALLCDRTREWLALRVDCELSEFETALMTAHLGRCERCREFGDELAGITRALRAAPLEPLPHPVALPPARRRLQLRQVQVAAAAAVLVVAAGVGSLYGVLRGSAHGAAPVQVAHAPMIGTASDSEVLLREIRMTSLTPTRTLPLGATKPVLKVSA